MRSVLCVDELCDISTYNLMLSAASFSYLLLWQYSNSPVQPAIKHSSSQADSGSSVHGVVAKDVLSPENL